MKREVLVDWKFHYGELEEAWYRGFSEDEFREVMVPHDWAMEMPLKKEYSSGTGYAAGGVGWYRTHFAIPADWQGKEIQITFDGIYKNSQVWCNSYYLGKRPYGYSTFTYNITHAVDFGGDNVIAVRVEHTDIADSRWYTGSGITRKVTLSCKEPVHPREYGVIFETKQVTEIDVEGGTGRAELLIRHFPVEGESFMGQFPVEERKGTPLHIRTALVNREGREVLTLEGSGKTGEEARLRGTLENAVLWSVETPYLYTLRTWYCPEGKEEYLAEESRVGIRSIAFDADRGFFLNGKEVKLKGVCVHHDGGVLGAAVTPEVWQRRLLKLKECGCNAIRCSHNPHMPELYDLCDGLGFLMMDEAFDEWENAKNKWSVGHNVYPPKHQGYFEDFPLWHEADLRGMVRRDRNHPSVVLWSIGNEIDYPNDPYCHPSFSDMTGNNDANKPAAERQYDANKPNAERLVQLAKRLEAIVKEEDASRPVTLAAAFPELSVETGLLDGLDVVGYNYKEHLYEQDHARMPEKPLLGSENGHGYAQWLAVRDNPYISGQFLWTGIDYLGESRGEWPTHGSAAGILTCAGEEKPEFYRRKAFWTKEPVIALAARRVSDGEEDWLPMAAHWNYEAGEEILVKVYSNLPVIRLFLNERQVGEQEGYNGDGCFAFRVKYEPGVLMAAGRGEALEPEKEYRAEFATTSEAAKISCQVWNRDEILEGVSWEEASERPGYLYQIEVQLLDENGKKVRWQEKEIRVKAEGAGELAGLESGNLSDGLENALAESRRTFAGQLLVFVRRKTEGEISVKIQAENCPEVSMRFT